MKLFDWLGKTVDNAEIQEALKSATSKAAERIAFKELALYIGISYIANALSQCEIKTFEKGEEVQNELYYKLNVNPNPNENSSQFINKVIETLYYKGEALVVPYKNNFYCADSFGTDESPFKGNTFDCVTIDNESITKKFKASDVFYFRLDDKKVKGLFDSLYNDYGIVLSSAIEKYKKDNGQRYKLELENYKAGDPLFTKAWNEVIQKQVKTFLENDNAVYPQFKGTNLTEMSSGSSTSSSDIIELRKEIFSIAAQSLKIPMSMMLGNITNMNEIVQVFLTICIDPLADMMSEEYTRKTTDYDMWKEGTRIKVDTSSIKHVDIIEVADNVSKAIGSGVVNIDDLRKRLGYQPFNTEESQALWITKNYDRIENVFTGMSETE